MRAPRAQSAFAWARTRLDRSTAAIVFTARFIPFARLAVNLTAGASRVPAPRYLAIAAVAATGGAAYQSFVGAIVAWIIPGSTVAAVLVSIAVALALGVAVDARWLAGSAREEVGMPVHDVTMTTSDAASSDGYGPGFLAVPVPLPITAEPRSTVDLPYLRFTVTLDRTRELAVVTGVNIDGSTLQDLPRTGTWHLDKRVPASEQTGPEVYADNDLDRGHLVRRRDPGWGPEELARAATRGTFVYTNAAPQASDFNQSKELWLGLEDHVLAYSDANDLRVSVFTAPVLSVDDPPYRGIQVPLRFWKVAAWTTGDPGELASAGFVLDQSALVDTTVEGARDVPPLGGFRTFQVPIRDIAAIAGVDFGPLEAADVFVRAPAVAQPWAELHSPADIVL
jgi:DNA/RNA endonuclease G (NUC1)